MFSFHRAALYAANLEDFSAKAACGCVLLWHIAWCTIVSVRVDLTDWLDLTGVLHLFHGGRDFRGIPGPGAGHGHITKLVAGEAAH